MGGKKLRTLPVACADEDLILIDACRNLQPAFPPSRSAIALILLRAGADRLIRGETTLQAMYQTYATEDWAAKEITVDVPPIGSTGKVAATGTNGNGATKR